MDHLVGVQKQCAMTDARQTPAKEKQGSGSATPVGPTGLEMVQESLCGLVASRIQAYGSEDPLEVPAAVEALEGVVSAPDVRDPNE